MAMVFIPQADGQALYIYNNEHHYKKRREKGF